MKPRVRSHHKICPRCADGSLCRSAYLRRPHPAPQTYDLLTINFPLPGSGRPTGLFKQLIQGNSILRSGTTSGGQIPNGKDAKEKNL